MFVFPFVYFIELKEYIIKANNLGKQFIKKISHIGHTPTLCYYVINIDDDTSQIF